MIKINQFNQYKVLMHFNKIKDILNDEIPYPVTVNLDLTNKCNYKCKWCYVDNYISKNRIEIDWIDVRRILEEVAEAGIKSVLFTGGGEPTIYPRFLDAINLASNLGFQIGLTTNGSKLITMINELPLDTFKYIRISVDASNPETYSYVHNCSPKIFDSMSLAVKHIHTNRPKTMVLGMSFLVTSYNYKEVFDSVIFARDIGFDYISIRPSVQISIPSKDELKVAINQCDNALKKIKGIEIYPITKRFQDLEYRRNIECKSTPLIGIITADCKLNICCQHRGKPIYQWGNLKENSFSDLWGNKEHRKIINSINSKKCPVCRMITYNEMIQDIFIDDKMHRNFL